MPIIIENCVCGETPVLTTGTKQVLQIICDNCGVGVYGTEAKEVIRKWNSLNGWQEEDDDE